MEARFSLVFGIASPLIFALNFFLKYRLSDLSLTLGGGGVGVLIGAVILGLNLDKALASTSLKNLSILYWGIIGMYSGYNAGVGMHAYFKLGNIAVFYVIAAGVATVACVGLYVLSRIGFVRKRFSYVFKSHCVSVEDYVITAYINVVVAEAFGNMVAIYSGLIYYLCYHGLRFLVYMNYYAILLFPALILASKYITREIIKRKKVKL
jgi:hypothetical protein